MRSVPMKLRRLLCATFGAAALFCALASPRAEVTSTKGPWEQVRNDNGITVLRRTVLGTQLHEFQGTAIVQAPISKVLAVLNDTEHRREWMKESMEQRVCEQLQERLVILYNRLDSPWPVDDRDTVMRASTAFDTQNKMVRIEIVSTTHPKCPPVKGAVRMPFMVGHWYLWPAEGGKWTKAEYQVHADPGGSLPDWLVNVVSKKLPHDTLTALREQVKRRNYPELEARIEAVPEYQIVVNGGRGATPAAPTPPAPSAVVPNPPAPPTVIPAT